MRKKHPLDDRFARTYALIYSSSSFSSCLPFLSFPPSFLPSIPLQLCSESVFHELIKYVVQYSTEVVAALKLEGLSQQAKTLEGILHTFVSSKHKNNIYVSG